jgi:exodeoxyribonuclease V gamma subunit
VDAALRFLGLIGSRVVASSLVDLLDFEAVRRAAGIEADEAETLRDWVRRARIRWGADPAYRRDVLGMPDDDPDTWRGGLDRLLMGYAVARTDTLVQGVLPLPISASDPDLLGRGVACFERLLAGLERLRRPRPLAAWAGDLRAVLAELLLPERETDAIALRSLLALIDDLALSAARAALDEPVTIDTVRAHLERRVESNTGGGGFLTGRVTFCSLERLRSIPAKVIAIVGLNDGAFPRLERRTSFDLIGASARPGDRSPRDTDRASFLETLLAARSRLILSYIGRSQKDNSALAPSHVVSELLDFVDACFGSAARDAIVIEHPLQPFSPRYFAPQAYSARALYSYSKSDAAAADALRAAAETPAPFCPSPLSRETSTEVTLIDLARFLGNPSKYFCTESLDLRLPDAEEILEDSEPFVVDGLVRYGLLERMLRSRVGDAFDFEKTLELSRGSGELPHTEFARASLAALDADARRFAERVAHEVGALPLRTSTHSVALAHADWQLTGSIEIATSGGLVRLRPAKLRPKDMLELWVEHLAACAMTDDAPKGGVESLLITSDDCLRLARVAEPCAELDRLIAIFREGRCRPLPFYERASHELAKGRLQASSSGKGGEQGIWNAVRRAFYGSKDGHDRTRSDIDDRYVALCTRDQDLEQEREELERTAIAVWKPLLAHVITEGGKSR